MSALTPERLAEPCKVTSGAFCMTHWSRVEPVSKECDLSKAQAEIERLRELLGDLIDPEPCEFDHHGGCQAHLFLSLEPGEVCPHAEAKALLNPD